MGQNKKGLEDFINDVNLQKTAAAAPGAAAPVASVRGMDFITKLAQEIQSSDAIPAAAGSAPPALPTEADTAAIDAAAASAAAAATASSPPKVPAEVNISADSPTGVGSSPEVQQAIAAVIGAQGAPDTADLSQEAPVQATPEAPIVSDTDQLVESPLNFNQSAQAQASEAAGGEMDTEKMSSAIMTGANTVLEKVASVYDANAANKVAEAYNGDLEKIGSIKVADENGATMAGALVAIEKIAQVYNDDVANYIVNEIEKVAKGFKGAWEAVKAGGQKAIAAVKSGAQKAKDATGLSDLIKAKSVIGPQKYDLPSVLARKAAWLKVGKRVGIPAAAALGVGGTGYAMGKSASAGTAAPVSLDDINAAVEIIKEAGLDKHVLDAQQKGYDCSDVELVKLGHQIIDKQEGMIKEAQNADRFGRQMARSYVDELTKIAGEEKPVTGIEKLATAAAAPVAPNQAQVNQAVETLRAAKLIQ